MDNKDKRYTLDENSHPHLRIDPQVLDAISVDVTFGDQWNNASNDDERKHILGNYIYAQHKDAIVNFFNGVETDGVISRANILIPFAPKNGLDTDLTLMPEPEPPLDTIAPDAPNVDAFPSLTKIQKPLITGTAETGSIITLLAVISSSYFAELGTAIADSNGNFSVSPSVPLNDNQYSLTLTATDVAGNVSEKSETFSITIDSTAPNAPSDLVAADGKTSTPTITGKAEAGSTVNLYYVVTGADDVELGTTTAESNGDFSITSSTLADGVYTLSVKSTDAAGNFSVSTKAITIDTTPPDAPSDLVASNLNTSTPTITGTAEAGSTVNLYYVVTGADDVELGSETSDINGDFSITSSTLADGVYSLTATATDEAGNVSGKSAPLPITIDSTAPDAPSDLEASNVNTSTPTITGKAEAGSIVNLSYVVEGADDVKLGTKETDSSGNFSIITIALADGDYSLTATATDAAGNVSEKSAPLPITIDTSEPEPEEEPTPVPTTGVVVTVEKFTLTDEDTGGNMKKYGDITDPDDGDDWVDSNYPPRTGNDIYVVKVTNHTDSFVNNVNMLFNEALHDEDQGEGTYLEILNKRVSYPQNAAFTNDTRIFKLAKGAYATESLSGNTKLNFNVWSTDSTTWVSPGETRVIFAFYSAKTSGHIFDLTATGSDTFTHTLVTFDGTKPAMQGSEIAFVYPWGVFAPATPEPEPAAPEPEPESAAPEPEPAPATGVVIDVEKFTLTDEDTGGNMKKYGDITDPDDGDDWVDSNYPPRTGNDIYVVKVTNHTDSFVNNVNMLFNEALHDEDQGEGTYLEILNKRVSYPQNAAYTNDTRIFKLAKGAYATESLGGNTKLNFNVWSTDSTTWVSPGETRVIFAFYSAKTSDMFNLTATGSDTFTHTLVTFDGTKPAMQGNEITINYPSSSVYSGKRSTRSHIRTTDSTELVWGRFDPLKTSFSVVESINYLNGWNNGIKSNTNLGKKLSEHEQFPTGYTADDTVIWGKVDPLKTTFSVVESINYLNGWNNGLKPDENDLGKVITETTYLIADPEPEPEPESGYEEVVGGDHQIVGGQNVRLQVDGEEIKL